MNLPEEDYRLAIGWVVAAYFTGIPHPILLVQGEQGTAKSNLIRTLLALVDPQPAADRTPPRDQREWAIFARASWAFSFDNITDIPPWLSNALCKGVTGDAVLQRVLHSDEDIGVYSFQRVIALTTIAIRHDVAGDLADRILLVEPEVIDKRRTEADITAARAAALPGALGAILDLVAGVLRELPGTAVDNAPRMADFAKVLAALDTVTGWDTLASYRAKVASLALSLIEGNTFAYAIYRLATCPSPGGLDPGPVGRHRRRTARHPPADLRRRPDGRQRPARGRPRGRPPDPRDRPVPAQGRHRHPAPQKRPSAPAAHHQDRNRRPRRPQEPETPLFLGIRKDMSHMSHRRITAGQRPRKVGHCHVPADVPHVPPQAGRSCPSCPTWDIALSHHRPGSAARWDMWDMTRARFPPGRHLHRRPAARGRGMPTPARPARGDAGTGAPPGTSCGPRLVTGRHPPPLRDSAEYAHARIQRPGPARARAGRARLAHPAAVAGQQTAPRQLPRLPRPARRRRATSRSACPCLAGGGWCHGVRAATTDPARITAWWHREPAAVPGVAAGPSGLVLVDIDAHGGQPPPRLATGLLPGIDLAAEPIPRSAWDDPARFRDGRDTLTLLARLRGGPRPWPAGPEHQPVTAATPSGGMHLWYQAPADGLRQALSDPQGRYGLAWQVDLKAGWSYGIAPGASHHRRHLPGTRRRPGPARPHARLARPRGHPRHHRRATARPATRSHRHPSPAGPARPPTWPPSSAAAPPSSPP